MGSKVDARAAAQGHRFSWWICVTAICLAGCAGPFQAGSRSPEAPRVADVTVTPDRIAVGCPVTLTVRFTDADADVVGVAAHLTRIQPNHGVERRYLEMPIEPARLIGQSGEFSTVLHPEGHGTHWYTFQFHDAAGHRSKPRQVPLQVDAPLPWRTSKPRCKQE